MRTLEDTPFTVMVQSRACPVDMNEADELRAAEIVKEYVICELLGLFLEYVIVYFTVGLLPAESVMLLMSAKRSPSFIHIRHLLKSLPYRIVWN